MVCEMIWDSPFEHDDIPKNSFNEDLTISVRPQATDRLDCYSLPIRTVGGLIYDVGDENFFYLKNTIFYAYFDEKGTQTILDSIVSNIPGSIEPRIFFNSYFQYLDEYYAPLPQSTDLSQELYLQSCVDSYWTLDDGTQEPKDWEFLDERLTAHLSWFYEGKEYSVKCYGYMTSLAFLNWRIKEKSPYYRRFMYVVKYFHHHYVDQWLGHLASQANFIHPLDREIFLMQYAEIEGQPNFYER